MAKSDGDHLTETSTIITINGNKLMMRQTKSLRIEKMISTVTTITVATIISSSSSSASLLNLGSSMALVAVLTLLVFLVEKELLGFSKSPRVKAFSYALNVGLIPLFIAFAVILVSKAGALIV